MNAKHKKGGRARATGAVALMTVELDPALMGALEAYCRRELRTKRSAVTLALQDYLARHGDWPAALPGKPAAR